MMTAAEREQKEQKEQKERVLEVEKGEEEKKA